MNAPPYNTPAHPITLTYQKTFRAGILQGITITEKMPFSSAAN